MKKFINSPEDFIPEVLNGIYLAHANQFHFVNNDPHCLVSTNKRPGKVAIVTGGGSGHLPLFLGYVGKGMLDGCGVGDIFQSPSPEQILSITQAVDSGTGVLYLYGNYNGDIFNFDMAAEMAEFESNIVTATVIAGDDIACPPPSAGEPSRRRGVAGIFFAYKCAGAAAAQMLDLANVQRIAQKACNNIRTIGVGLSPCIVPRVGKPSFHIGEDEMEIGIGIHGESGIRRGEKQPANSIVDELMNNLLADFPLHAGDEVAVLINGLGATPLEELYLVYGRAYQTLKNAGINVFKTYVGEYATAMEMAGLSISLMRVDDELKQLLAHEANTPMFKQFQGED